MKLWRAYDVECSYEWREVTIIGVFESRADADLAVLVWYENLENKTRRNLETDKEYDVLEGVNIEEFETGEVWEI